MGMVPAQAGTLPVKFFKSQEAAKAACLAAPKSGACYAYYVAVPGEGWLVKLVNKFGEFAGLADAPFQAGVA